MVGVVELQKIDCNCNDCVFMLRDIDYLKRKKQITKETGISHNYQYGDCTKLDKRVFFSPNTMQIDTQDCFKHRKD